MNLSNPQTYFQTTYDSFGNAVPASLSMAAASQLGSAFPNPIDEYVTPGSISAGSLSTPSLQGDYAPGASSITIDTTQSIQRALDTLNGKGGGTLYLKAGTYKVPSTLKGYSSITIQGVSPSATILDFQSTNRSLAFAGTSAYTTGTITSITAGVNVTGSGTLWLANVTAGSTLFLGTRSYVVAAVTSNTTLILAEGYIDSVTLPSSYRITTQAVNVTISGVQFTKSSGTALTFNDSRFVQLINCQFISNNVGLAITNCSEIQLDGVLVVTSTSDGIQMTNFGRFDWQSVNCISNGGNGFTLNNCKTGAMVACTADSQTGGDGVNITTGVDLYMVVDASGNSGKGVQYVSGCDDCDLTGGLIANNTSDGIKLTASTTNCHFYGTNLKGNGGYGVNIAVAGDSNTVITTNTFATNTSGALNNLGTGTVTRANSGLADSGGTSVTSLLTATGTIDDSNTAFTFTQQPTVITVNGLGYRVNNGWTWNSGTLTATLATAVGVGGDIYGVA